MAENRELALVLKLVADQFQSELKKSGGALGEFNKFISDWKVQLTASGTALFAIAKSTANYGEELLKTSQKIGIKVSALAGLQHAANLADLSNESLSTGLKKLSVNMVDAARQTGDGEALFRRLGVSATDAAGQLRPTEQVLLDLADVFANSKDGAGKAEVAVKLFGKAGLDLIPFLNQGKVGIKELMAEAERLGLVMSRQDAEAANKFNDELKKLTAQVRGMTLAVGKELIPTMTELITLFRNLGSGTGLSFGMRMLHIQFVALNALLKELQANAQFLSGTGKDAMNLDQLRARIAEIEVDARKKLYDFKHPGVLTDGPDGPAGTAAGSSTPKGEIAVLADQEKLGKAKLEIFLASNRALDIRNRLDAEDAAVIERTYRHILDFRDQEEQNERDREERLGALAVHATGLEVKIREEALAKERDGLAQNAQAWLDYHQQVGGSTQIRYDKELELLTANLTKQLDLTTSETARLLTAWQEHDSEVADDILAKTSLTATQRETIELQSLAKIAAANERASDDVVAGWARGMQNYVRQTGNGFNLATDMARQTAQTMEQGFKTFFFDLFEGRVNSLKDVMRSLLNFAKQIIAQISAQLVTKQILTFATSFAGAGGAPTTEASFASSGTGFATGGSFRVPGSGGTDTTPVGFWATPGETVDIRTPGQSGGGPINIAITVNTGGGSQQSGSGAAPNFSQLAREISRLVESKLIDEQRPGGLLAGGMA